MPELKRMGVVYEVPCNDCDHVYIGETGRTLGKRLKDLDCGLNIGPVWFPSCPDHITHTHPSTYPVKFLLIYCI